jgi:hypothetical protein
MGQFAALAQFSDHATLAGIAGTQIKAPMCHGYVQNLLWSSHLRICRRLYHKPLQLKGSSHRARNWFQSDFSL